MRVEYAKKMILCPPNEMKCDNFSEIKLAMMNNHEVVGR